MEVVTSNIQRMTSPSMGKSPDDIEKEGWKGNMRSGGQESTCLKSFSVISATFEI